MLEILAPAGNADCAEAAIANGANAIYLGLGSFSARQSADNFNDQAFCEVLQSARLRGVKVYVAMNTIVKDEELDDFLGTILSAWNAGADAIILQDIFLGRYVGARYPEINLHLSTQAGVCTLAGAQLAKEYGFSRVILARETPLIEIEKIAACIETEVFVQGALCTAFSGQCFFSSFVGGNSGNRGRCKQPCRKQYAYNRSGREEKCYALSPSDLCVGEDIEKLIKAGVTSFKIEGRMRRAEYVGAAVKYYRRLLDEQTSSPLLLSDLKRTYNRGNYTRGLGFGQDKRFLSTSVQGHIGEKVGVVKVVNGQYLVESTFKPQIGDGFKVLRGGEEVGGGSYLKMIGRHFVLQSKARLKNGDNVFVTTDTAANMRALSASKKGALSIELYFSEGEYPIARCGEVIHEGKNPLQTAQNRALTEAELRACFEKVDGLPVEINFSKIELKGNIFLPKSELNAFRREFYAQVTKSKKTTYEFVREQAPTFFGKNAKTAVIASDFAGLATDIAIYKAEDLSLPLPESFLKGSFEKYLYYPAFLKDTDLQRLAELCKEGMDGIYAENYAGLSFAKSMGIKLFAGAGFHILNARTLATLLKEPCVAYYTLSKEGDAQELTPLISDKAFVLSSGDIKLMDLCYCPFGKSCSSCDKKGVYLLTDENNRIFPVRRYLSALGECRFEVYNCANLVGIGLNDCGKLLDLSVTKNKEEAFLARDNEAEQKKAYTQYTSGHYKRGVL